MHQDIIDALRLAEDRQNYAVGGFGRQKGRTSVTSPTSMQPQPGQQPKPNNMISTYQGPMTRDELLAAYRAETGNPEAQMFPPGYKGTGVYPGLLKESGGMFIPSEISGRRSSLNPFYRPDMKPTDATSFQADLGRPDMIPTDANGKPLPSNLPTGLMMPDDRNNPNTRFHKPTYEEMYGYKDSGGMFIPSEVSGRRSALNPFRPNPAPAGDTFQADLGRPDPQKIGYGPDGKIAYAPGYKGSGVNPELVAGYRPPITNQGPGIGLAPPALPPGLDYNTMPPSVRDLFAPAPGRPQPGQQPKPQPVPGTPVPPSLRDLYLEYPGRPRLEQPGQQPKPLPRPGVAPPPPMMPPMASPRPSNPFAVNPVGMIPDFMNGAGQGQMPQPTPLEQLGQPYPMMPQQAMPQQAAPMPQPTMPQQMMPQQTSPVFQPFANAGQQQPFFGGTGTKAGPSVGGLYRRR